ncbi:MAG TPA: lipid-A-disaccharide synthase [Rhodobacteraceae bacterium]|nr:lipid-A-disaccharide synthase [Paracoccaceae bacterium]
MPVGAAIQAASPLRIAVIAGEVSGDALGAGLISALRELTAAEPVFLGVGGEAMAAAGVPSLFPLADIAVMGPLEILAVLPRLLKRIRQTAAAIVAFSPDVVVIIDSPEFTHRVARAVRRILPDVPVVDYVAPSVWFWRPGRARRMRAYIDKVLALLPFEPEAYRRLGGPECVFVGHPLHSETAADNSGEPERRSRLDLDKDVPVLLVMPGSRGSEIHRLMAPFGQALAALNRGGSRFQAVLPAVPHLREEIERRAALWPVPVRIMDNADAHKQAAFSLAHAALAASGTTTLELAMAGIPMVVGYKIDAFTGFIVRKLAQTDHVSLPNLIAGRTVVPEFLQGQCTGDLLAAALAPLLRPGEERERQLRELADIARRVRQYGPAEHGRLPPHGMAARAVLDVVQSASNN